MLATVITPIAPVSTVRPKSFAGSSSAAVVAQAGVDRDERGGQAGRHEDVQGDLRDPERRVVGVELGAGAVGVGEHPVADDAHREVRERQDRQDDRAAREDPIEQAPRRDGDRGQRRGSASGVSRTAGRC